MPKAPNTCPKCDRAALQLVTAIEDVRNIGEVVTRGAVDIGPRRINDEGGTETVACALCDFSTPADSDDDPIADLERLYS